MFDVVKDKYTLMFGDCLERMKEIPAESIDMILVDLPCKLGINKYAAVQWG